MSYVFGGDAIAMYETEAVDIIRRIINIDVVSFNFCFIFLCLLFFNYFLLPPPDAIVYMEC